MSELRSLFPALHQEVNGHPLTYLDNAASSLTLKAVIDALRKGLECDRSNVHRGVHELSQRATTAFEKTRNIAKNFLNASRESEIIYTSGTTEAINLVAQTWGKANVRAGDEILLTELEHHSNIVPWQMLAQEKNATIKVARIHDSGALDLDDFRLQLSSKTKIAAFNHASNALGTLNPAKELVALAKEVGALTLIDGAQTAPHIKIDVQDLDCDFYAFSGHKVFGPTGTGIFYGKQELLEVMPPYKGGGDMIEKVTFAGSTYAAPPSRFEAGTPNIVGITALGPALEWTAQHIPNDSESDLLAQATSGLKEIPGIQILGDIPQKLPVISFVVDGVHAQDVGVLLNKYGVAVRTGHHCAEPLLARLGVAATTRASFAVYNTPAEVDHFLNATRKAVEMLR